MEAHAIRSIECQRLHFPVANSRDAVIVPALARPDQEPRGNQTPPEVCSRQDRRREKQDFSGLPQASSLHTNILEYAGMAIQV